MPRPIPVAIRRQIVERHQAGEPLTKIAAEVGLAYESVRNVWRLYRREGRITPNYAACGREIVASQRVYRAAVWLKRWHPGWGAGLIRQVIREKWPEEYVPHERSLQRWFRVKNVHTPRRKRLQADTPVGRGREPHNIWEMDSREQIGLANGEQVSWLVISDEASGAVLEAQVFPPGTRCPVDSQ